MKLALVMTERCNAACAHCSDSCGPDKTAALPVQRMRGLMSQAAALADDDGELVFGLTGGEPFLDFDALLEVVAHGSALGGRVTCMTNAYWASSDDKARARLLPLRERGLQTLGVSTSRFHQQFVAPERVRRALRIAREAGIRTVLKCALTRRDDADGALLAWARASGADAVESFPVLPYLREGQRWPKGEFPRARGLPRGTCPSPQLTIAPDGTAYTCCHPGGSNALLALGNVADQELDELRDRFYLRGVQRLLRERGPIHFARAARAAGHGGLLRESYGSTCDLCAHIGSDARLAQVARHAAAAFERRQVRELFGTTAQGGHHGKQEEAGGPVQGGPV